MYKVKKIIQLVKKETKYLNPIYGSIPLRKHEPLKNYPNIQKAKKLNWSPKISLHQGIKKQFYFTNQDYKLKNKNLNFYFLNQI